MKYIIYIFLLFIALPSIGQQFYNSIPSSLPYIKTPTNVTAAPFLTNQTRSDTMVVTGTGLGSGYFGGVNGVDSLHPFVVYYNGTSGAGFGIENCNYIKVIGLNGATISGGGTNGYIKKADFAQVSGFKNLNGTNGGWWLKLESPQACDYAQPLDYLNGLASNTIITHRIMHIWFTHNQIGNTDGTNSCGGEGVYAISTGAYGRDAVPCLSNTIYKPLWGGFFHIDSNYIYNVGRTGIQLSGCDTGFNTIVGNHIFNAGRELNSTQGAGIRTGYGTANSTYIANNEVRNSYIYNYDLETGAIFENNIGDSAGFWKQTENPQGVPSVIASAALANSTVIIKGNTMGVNTASPSTGIAIYGGSNYTSDNVVCNNTTNVRILATPFNYSTDCGDTPIPPTANAGNDTTVTNPATIVLSGSYTQGTGAVTSTVWSNSDGCAIDSADSLHTFATCPEGTHTFTLTVTDDNDLSGNDNKTATVNAAPADTSKTVYLKSNLKYLKLKFNIPANNINYGVFALTGNTTAALDTANAIGNLKTVRYNYIYDTHNNYNVKQVQDSGYECALTFGYYRPQDNPNFQTDTTLYKAKLDSLLSVQSPERVAIENEFANGNIREFAAAKYANILKAATTVAHNHNVKISDGGWVVNNLTFPIMRYASQAGDTATLGKIKRALGYDISDTSNSTIKAVLRYWDTAYAMMKDIPYDESNLHWYELPTTDDYSSQTSQLLPIYVQFLKDRFNKPVITTEFGTHNTNIPLLYSLLKELKNASVDVQIYFAGVGTDGLAKDLHQYYSDWLKYK